MDTADRRVDMIVRLQSIDVDVAGTINRFCGNEALYRKFLLKFLDDPTFAEIGPALDAGDVEQAFRLVHTFKGVTGNLGLTRLYRVAGEMTEALRAGCREDAAQRYPELEEAYHEVAGILREEAPYEK